MLGYFAFTDYISRGAESNRLQRTRRVLDKYQLFIGNQQAEIKALRKRIASLEKKCKRRTPLVLKPALDAKLASEITNHEIAAVETTKYFPKRTKIQERSHGTANISMGELQYRAPSLRVEITRRRASKELREMWYYLSAEVTKINKLLGSSLKRRLTAMLDNFAEIHRALSNNLDKINNEESLLTWRKREQARLSRIIQNRLRRLQNPKDCDSARKLLCDINKGCGYGCQVHHLLYCFLTAYGSKRTLIINSNSWRYSDKRWESIFLPVSNSCTVAKGPADIWSAGTETSTNVQLPIVDAVSPNPNTYR